MRVRAEAAPAGALDDGAARHAAPGAGIDARHLDAAGRVGRHAGHHGTQPASHSARPAYGGSSARGRGSGHAASGPKAPARRNVAQHDASPARRTVRPHSRRDHPHVLLSVDQAAAAPDGAAVRHAPDPAAAPRDALAIEGVSKRYGPVTALADVSLRIGRGRFLTLLGPSGSGKSTLLSVVAGFTAPDHGRVLLGGAPITHLPPERRNFGMVFQGYALFPHLSIAENVAFPLRVRRRPRAEVAERVAEALATVRLSAQADRRPHQLSGGQQQRAALARALVFRPELVLLDEPLSALDKSLRLEMQAELRDLHRRVGVTFVTVTHDQAEALSMADEIAILRDGRLVQQGAPAALYERPRTRFVAGFLGRSNFLSGIVQGAEGDGFLYRCGPFLLRQAGAAASAGDAVLLALRPELMRPLAPGEACANRVSARVLDSSYGGDGHHLLVEGEGVGRLSVTVPSWRRAPPAPGAAVVLGWEPDASVPVAEDGA